MKEKPIELQTAVGTVTNKCRSRLFGVENMIFFLKKADRESCFKLVWSGYKEVATNDLSTFYNNVTQLMGACVKSEPAVDVPLRNASN